METKCICSIRKVYKAIAAFEAELQASLGLNINEAMLLCLLSEKSDLSAGEIADAMSLTRSNSSKVIASLEKKGLLKRRTCKEDCRSMRFHLTAKGKELLDKVHCDSIKLPDSLQELVD
jgi:DNA-binding MarR family transcriptional regulator